MKLGSNPSFVLPEDEAEPELLDVPDFISRPDFFSWFTEIISWYLLWNTLEIRTNKLLNYGCMDGGGVRHQREGGWKGFTLGSSIRRLNVQMSKSLTSFLTSIWRETYCAVVRLYTSVNINIVHFIQCECRHHMHIYVLLIQEDLILLLSSL